MTSTAKTIVSYIACLVIAVFLYQIISRTHAAAAVPPNRVAVTKKVEYSIAPLRPFADDLRAVLESKGNEGWELVAPVVSNGTTTALIFKRERK
jgi:hypothetical protein